MAALTISLHGLAFWLICLHSNNLSAAIGLTSAETEQFFLEALDALKTVGASSLLSVKAHQCLQRYVPLVKTFGMAPIFSSLNLPYVKDTNAIPALNPNETQAQPEAANGAVLQEDFLDFMFGSVDDVFRQLGDNEFLGSDVLSMEQSINNYDAGGILDRWN